MNSSFMSREKPNPIDWDKIAFELTKSNDDNIEIVVLRAILFFHTDQIITLSKLKKYFTDHAINSFEVDGYIKRK